MRPPDTRNNSVEQQLTRVTTFTIFYCLSDCFRTVRTTPGYSGTHRSMNSVKLDSRPAKTEKKRHVPRRGVIIKTTCFLAAYLVCNCSYNELPDQRSETKDFLGITASLQLVIIKRLKLNDS